MEHEDPYHRKAPSKVKGQDRDPVVCVWQNSIASSYRRQIVDVNVVWRQQHVRQVRGRQTMQTLVHHDSWDTA